MKDEVQGAPQRDDGTLSPAVLLQTERLKPQNVPVETQGQLEIPHPQFVWSAPVISTEAPIPGIYVGSAAPA